MRVPPAPLYRMDPERGTIAIVARPDRPSRATGHGWAGVRVPAGLTPSPEQPILVSRPAAAHPAARSGAVARGYEAITIVATRTAAKTIFQSMAISRSLGGTMRQARRFRCDRDHFA